MYLCFRFFCCHVKETWHFDVNSSVSDSKNVMWVCRWLDHSDKENCVMRENYQSYIKKMDMLDP
jgi:hypothetical protein